VLNKLGRRTGKGNPRSELAVKTARRNHGIDGLARSLVDADVLTLQGAARYTNTSDTTIKKLFDAGILPMRQVVPFAPWEIPRAAAPEALDVARRRRRAWPSRGRRRGDVVRVDEVLPPTASDEAIVTAAIRDGRHIITQDPDFSAIVALSGRIGPSVISLRLSSLGSSG
jgi:uncharacterized protein DUF5615